MLLIDLQTHGKDSIGNILITHKPNAHHDINTWLKWAAVAFGVHFASQQMLIFAGTLMPARNFCYITSMAFLEGAKLPSLF